LGTVKYFLGLKLARTTKGISVSQRNYTLDILQDSGILAAKPSIFPMEFNLKISQDNGLPLADPTPCRRLIGRLIYLTRTRPYIAFSVQVLSQYMDSPRQPHMDAASHVLLYLKNNQGKGIFLSFFLRFYTQSFL
jgi:hypothetical protein